MTLQTTIVLLAGLILGAKTGMYSAFIYILLGIIGIPVFAQLRGGVDVVFGPGGGFILSFPLMAFLAGLGAKTDKNQHLIFTPCILLTAATILNFLCGLLWFVFLTDNSVGVAFTLVVAPFIPLAVFDVLVLTVFGHKLPS